MKLTERIRDLLRSDPERKLIIAVDCDGTVWTDRYPEIGEPNEALLAELRDAQAAGHYIVAWTMREGQDDLICDWFLSQGVVLSAVNDNLPHVKTQWGNNPRKIFADVYVDNLALHVCAGENGKTK